MIKHYRNAVAAMLQLTFPTVSRKACKELYKQMGKVYMINDDVSDKKIKKHFRATATNFLFANDLNVKTTGGTEMVMEKDIDIVIKAYNAGIDFVNGEMKLGVIYNDTLKAVIQVKN